MYFLLLLFAGSVHLAVRIVPRGIEYRFFPFHVTERLIPFSDIKIVEVRDYKPMSEYGGWGIRGNAKRRAYTISGKKGMEFHLKSRRIILLGTQKQDEFATALRSTGVVISRTKFE